MSVYLHVTLELHAAKQATFYQAMEEIVPIIEKAGWKLRGAFAQRTGRLHSVIDLWELDDYNHYDRALKTLMAHQRFPQLSGMLAEAIVSETVVFADKASYMR